MLNVRMDSRVQGFCSHNCSKMKFLMCGVEINGLHNALEMTCKCEAPIFGTFVSIKMQGIFFEVEIFEVSLILWSLVFIIIIRPDPRYWILGY